MRIGSLCSGYGGLDRAVEELTGGEVVWVSDIDKGACKILAHRYPDVPNLGDFTKTKWTPDCPDCGEELRAINETPGSDGYIYWCPECRGEFPVCIRPDDMPAPIDVLTAGYPCQPFSHAGKREGTRDDRHLWPEVLRCLTSLRPPFALFENVRGHLSLGFDQVLADLASHDYDARWIVIKASDPKIGAPHGRARLFFLAVDAFRGSDRWDLVGAGRGPVRVGGVHGEDPATGGNEGRAGVLGGLTLLSTPQSRDHKGVPADGFNTANLCRDVALLPTPQASEAAKAVSGQSVAHREAGGHQVWLTNVIHDLALLPTPAVNDMGAAYTPEEWDAWTDRMKAEHGNGNGHGKSLSIEAQRLLPTPTTSYTATSAEEWRARRPAGNGAVRDAIGDLRIVAEELPERWGDYTSAIHRWEQILGRPAPAPTMTSAKGNPQLAPRFVEWMMGLPEGWVDDVPNLTRNEKLKALGNGVVWQQAAEAVRRLLAIGQVAA